MVVAFNLPKLTQKPVFINIYAGKWTEIKMAGCHGNLHSNSEIFYQPVFGDKCYTVGHKFTISVTMDVSPFAWY